MKEKKIDKNLSFKPYCKLTTIRKTILDDSLSLINLVGYETILNRINVSDQKTEEFLPARQFHVMAF